MHRVETATSNGGDNGHSTRVLTSEESKQKNFLDVSATSSTSAKKSHIVITKLTLLIMSGCLLLLLLAAIFTTYLVTSEMCEATVDEDGDDGPSMYRSTDQVLDRLPRNVFPTYYRIHLRPYVLIQNFTCDGHVAINVTCTTASDNITVNVNDIFVAYESISVCEHTASACVDVSVRDHWLDKDKQMLTVFLDTPMQVDANYTISMNFTSVLNDLLQGFYRSSYIDGGSGELRLLASTQFSPTDARRAFPCFDEPDFKSQFSISIARDSHKHMTLSNMPLKKTERIPEQDNWVWDHYRDTPKMSTYLVAFHVSDLKPFNEPTSHARREAKYKFQVWSRSDVLHQTRYAGQIGPKVLAFFEKYFDIDFPLPKIDMVAVPDFGFNAMENWGLIMYRESAMLYHSIFSSSQAKENVAQTIAHELGHQWFGNLVTPAWWDNLWLKEGFASYLAYIGVDVVEPSWEMNKQFVIDYLYESFALDQLKSSHPIYQPVVETTDIRQLFDFISYRKGASILRMMNHFLGETTFKKGLESFLNAYAYGNAQQDNLWQALDNAMDEGDRKLPVDVTVKDVMDTWTLQKGFPMVNVFRNYSAGYATVSQVPFLISGESNDTSTWYVPISYTTKTTANFNNTLPSFWLAKGDEYTMKVSGNEEWLLLNIQNTGYYRVNYDHVNWANLVKNFASFPPSTRAQLIEDAFSIAQAGALHYDIPLGLLLVLSAKKNGAVQSYYEWKAADPHMEYINNMLMFTPTYGEYKKFLGFVLQRAYNSLGFDERRGDDHLTLKLRPIILKWMCKIGDPDCVRNAQLKFRQAMMTEDPIMARNDTPPNLKSVIFCTTIKAGGSQEWDHTYERYLSSDTATDKEVLLDTLGCASEPWILAQYLNLSVSGNIELRKQDGARVFQSVARNSAGYQLAYDFLRNNWNEITTYYGEAFNTVFKMVSSLHYFLNSPHKLEELISFKNEVRRNIGSTERAFDNSIEHVEANIQWMERSFNHITGWLRQARGNLMY